MNINKNYFFMKKIFEGLIIVIILSLKPLIIVISN
jgi:hypothetical protein